MSSLQKNLRALQQLPTDAQNYASFALYAIPDEDIAEDAIDYHDTGIEPYAEQLADIYQAAKLINSDVMLLGYNEATRENKSGQSWGNFHETIKNSHDRYVPAAVLSTFAEGGYMSDLFKDLHLTDANLVHRLFRSTLPKSRIKLTKAELAQVAGANLAEIFDRSIQLFMAEYRALQPKVIILFGKQTQDDFRALCQYYPEFAVDLHQTQLIDLKHYAPRAEKPYAVAHQNREILEKFELEQFMRAF